MEAAGIPYMVTGSMAAIAYGEPRLTNDIDIVLKLNPPDASRLPDIYPETSFYLPPKEVIVVESKRRTRGHFNIIHHATGRKADIYTTGADPAHEWGLANRIRIELDSGDAFCFAPPEYVIARKLQYWEEGKSEKHINDIAAIIAVSGPDLDINAIEKITLNPALNEKFMEMMKNSPDTSD
jgi:hypothetical protein